MKTNFKKIAVMALLSASVVAGCKKEQSTDQNPGSLSYRVMDRMQVNNDDGRPRPLNTLPVINGDAIAFNRDALSSGQVTLKNNSSANLLLNVVTGTGEKLMLAQNYAAADGFASGTVYYALKNN